MTSVSNHPTRRIAAFTFLSWLGGYIHHRVELPQLTLLSPEHFIPLLFSIVLYLIWWRSPKKRFASIALLLWAFFPQFLGGAVLSVIPFRFWPFYPSQTVEHYFIHGVYALAQVPLMFALIGELRPVTKNRITTGASA
jgi:hypothetical protein